jgi:DNA-binding CsgD family transcriptional regulator
VTEPVERPATGELERARDAYARRAWLEAHDAFGRADARAPLELEDLELYVTAALMLARDDEAVAVLERAHQGYLERGEPRRAARAAAWIGLNLATRGAVGPASGWFGRAQRLLDEQAEECAERGYLLMPSVFRHEAAGDFMQAAAVAEKAAALGLRFGDPDLFAMALHAQGHMLVKAGRCPEGFALLDEAMVAVTTGELSPFAVGIVYCGVILACQSVFEVGRAREWTRALAEWADEQPELVAFTGRCRIHRAEVLQLSGSWPDALEEARLAGSRFLEDKNPAVGLAYYRQGELLRLLGRFEEADEAYRQASRLGWEPQPGLAQLRLAQGKVGAALAAIRRASKEIQDPLKRATLLPAEVEIALAAGELDEARAAKVELGEVAATYDSPMLAALAAHEQGAMALADGEPQRALVSLREAQKGWLKLDAPYEVARTRVLVSQACAALGDAETSKLELESAREIFSDLGAAPDLARLDDASPGRHGLSPRELEVLTLVASGKSNRDIASTLVISEHTVARHVQNIYAKLRLSSRAAATAFAFEHDLV